MVSVVMAAYNGEKYVIEQLDSIREQSRKADEVMIFDDCSTDQTVELCEIFIKKYALSGWTVVKNPYRQGYYLNFMNGLTAAHGDILILSDQDDIWCRDKIETIEAVMGAHPYMMSLTTTFSRFDDSGATLDPHVIHPHSKRNCLVKLSWGNFFKFHSYLGMSMAVRRTLLEHVNTANPNHITHDIVLNMYAVRAEGLYHLDQVLTRRRSYNLSTSNKRIRKEIDTKYRGNAQLQYLARKIQLLEPEQFGFPEDEFGRSMLQFRDNYIKRYEYILNKNILSWAENLANFRYYEGAGQYMKDLSAILKREKKE